MATSRASRWTDSMTQEVSGKASSHGPISFALGHLGLDYTPHTVVALSWHLGEEAHSGHYCTAIKEGNQW